MTDYYAQIHGKYFDGSIWSTGIHITSSRTPTDMLTTWSGAVNDMWTNATYGLETLYPELTVVTSVSVATLNSTMRETAKSFLAVSYPGTSTADTLPLLNSSLVSLRSANIQRKGRGRMYLPAMAETFVNNDVLTDTAAERVKAAVVALFAAVRTDGSTIFVFNRKPTTDKNPPVIPAFTKETILEPFASNKPARQSRRTRRKAARYF